MMICLYYLLCKINYNKQFNYQIKLQHHHHHPHLFIYLLQKDLKRIEMSPQNNTEDKNYAASRPNRQKQQQPPSQSIANTSLATIPTAAAVSIGKQVG